MKKQAVDTFKKWREHRPVTRTSLESNAICKLIFTAVPFPTTALVPTNLEELKRIMAVSFFL